MTGDAAGSSSGGCLAMKRSVCVLPESLKARTNASIGRSEARTWPPAAKRSRAAATPRRPVCTPRADVRGAGRMAMPCALPYACHGTRRFHGPGTRQPCRRPTGSGKPAATCPLGRRPLTNEGWSRMGGTPGRRQGPNLATKPSLPPGLVNSGPPKLIEFVNHPVSSALPLGSAATPSP